MANITQTDGYVTVAFHLFAYEQFTNSLRYTYIYIYILIIDMYYTHVSDFEHYQSRLLYNMKASHTPSVDVRSCHPSSPFQDPPTACDCEDAATPTP